MLLFFNPIMRAKYHVFPIITFDLVRLHKGIWYNMTRKILENLLKLDLKIYTEKSNTLNKYPVSKAD